VWGPWFLHTQDAATLLTFICIYLGTLNNTGDNSTEVPTSAEQPLLDGQEMCHPSGWKLALTTHWLESLNIYW
jgi:hypothetical protein